MHVERFANVSTPATEDNKLMFSSCNFHVMLFYNGTKKSETNILKCLLYPYKFYVSMAVILLEMFLYCCCCCFLFTVLSITFDCKKKKKKIKCFYSCKGVHRYSGKLGGGWIKLKMATRSKVNQDGGIRGEVGRIMEKKGFGG